MTESNKAVFLSYASEDAEAARRVAEALRSAGVEVWFDQSELRGGDAWDHHIRRQIRDCTLFVPIVSGRTQARPEGYFRLEWRLADERSHLMGRARPFIVPVCIDRTPERDADVPDSFEHVQWTRLPGGETPVGFCERIKMLLSGEGVARPPSNVAQAPIALPRQTPRRWKIITAAAVLAIAVGGWQAWRLMAPKPGAAALQASGTATVAAPEKSIAVLPFVDMSEKKDQEYFADGMAEEIIDRLARVSALRVPARTSSFYFKGKSTKISEIARELGVVNILEGSVRKAGNHLRIAVQLVRADNGFPIWSESYDRDLKDVFAIQDEIATAVAVALQITLTGGPLTRESGGTHNLEAYQDYLRAGISSDANTTSGLNASRQQLEHAVALDPAFGLAWARLATVWIMITNRGDVPPQEGFERVRQLAAHAITLSPGLANAHASLAYVYRNYDWNWEAARAEIDRALEIDPSDQLSLMFAGMLAQTLGKHGDADRLLRAALARDPLWSYANFSFGNALYLAGRYGEAEAAFRKVLKVAPDFTWARTYLAKTLLAESKPREALETLQSADLAKEDLTYLPMTLLANNRHAEADAALQEEKSKYGNEVAFYLAQEYAYRNESDLALQWLERAYAQKDTGLPEIVGERLFKNLWKDPRYKAFLRKMKLPET